MNARRHRRLRRLERAGPAQPRPGRRRRAAVRRAVRDAHLARPGQAQHLQPHAGRRDRRDPGAERAGLGRPARRRCRRCRASSSTPRITAQTRLQTAGAVPQTSCCACNADGSQVRLRRRRARRARQRELQHRSPATTASRPRASAIQLATGANALDTVDGVDATLERARAVLPAGPRGRSTRSTPRRSCALSIEEVVKTLLEAIVLVFLVMYLFLQNFRATLIPTIAVPVVLLGTFGVLAAFGFSINTLTMFGMVLAIGLLVDDAIVVVENVERVMARGGPVAAGGDAQVDGPDHRRAGRHRAGAGGGVRADGVLRRLDRRDLPPVLDHASSRRWCCRCWSRSSSRRRCARRCSSRVDDGPRTSDDAASSAGSTALRRAAAARYQRGRAAACSRAAGRFMLVYAAIVVADGACCSCACRPRSCPTRTRASCSARCRRRRAPRRSAR